MQRNKRNPLTALNVGTSQLSCRPKVNANELSLKWHTNIILTDLLIVLLSWLNLFLHMGPYKAWGVVVPYGLGVAKCLQHWVSLNDLVLQRALREEERSLQDFVGKYNKSYLASMHTQTHTCLGVGGFAPRGSNVGEILDDFLSVFSLASTRFSTGGEKQ